MSSSNDNSQNVPASGGFATSLSSCADDWKIGKNVATNAVVRSESFTRSLMVVFIIFGYGVLVRTNSAALRCDLPTVIKARGF